MPDVITFTAHVAAAPARVWIARIMRLTAVASVGVYVFTCLLQFGLVGQVALLGDPRKTAATALISALVLALHCWHLHFGLQGRPPPHGLVSLLAMWALVAVGLAVVGVDWVWTFAVAATSAILVLPRVWGPTTVVAVIGAVYLIQPHGMGLLYALSTAYRCVIMTSVVWFIAAATQVNQLREVRAREAVADERARLGVVLAGALGDHVNSLVDRARGAQQMMSAGQVENLPEVLRALDTEAREALDHTRRIVRDLRSPGAKDDLRALHALLTRDTAGPP
jgi:signal transduction histidine kinase